MSGTLHADLNTFYRFQQHIFTTKVFLCNAKSVCIFETDM